MRVSIVNVNLVGQDAIGQAILHQARFFRRRGDTVGIYAMHPPQGISEDVAQLVRVVDLATLGARRDLHFSRSDLFIFHYPAHYALMESIKEIDRGAVIFYYHNVTPPELWGSSFAREDLQRSIDRAGTFAFYADLIVTDSEFNAEQLIQEHGCERDHVRVLPLGIPLDEFSPGPPDAALLRRHGLDGKQAILFVGRVAGNKRIDLLVEALPLVQAQVPQARLLLVGDDSSNPAHQETAHGIRTRAQALGVANDVVFTGTVDAVAPYFRLADVYATASLHEGFGVPLIEAMASGVPVVASRATAHPWVVGEAGILVEPGDAQALADAVVRVLQNDELHGDLVQRGLARAREFSLDRYEMDWSRIVGEVTAWLPEPVHVRRPPQGQLPTSGAGSEVEMPEIEEALETLRSDADVMLRGYTVRSGLPLLGGLIAWVRRNLTSHLREPYLDPTLERQVTFNRQLVVALEMVARRLPAFPAAAQAAPAEDRLQRVEAWLGLLSAQIDRLEPGQGALDDGTRQQMESLLQELQAAVRDLRPESGDQARDPEIGP